MPFARVWTSETPFDLEPAFVRLGLPPPARDYLLEKLPHRTVLLTGLGDVERRFLKSRADLSVAPGHEAYPAFVAGDPKKRPGSALLFGRKDQYERLIEEAVDPELRSLTEALRDALAGLEPPRRFRVGGRDYPLAGAPYVMGVVNVTPDSFSDGGRFVRAEAAIEHGLSLAEAGADFLDIGGESTRPGAEPVGVEEELGRVLPVVRALRLRTDRPISIDTAKAQVAKAALEAGASWVNDVTALGDPAMLQVVVEAGCTVCLMHMRGTPRTMQQAPHYEDCVAEVVGFLRERVERLLAAGFPRDRLLIDPGIGFGKTPGHNLFLLRRLGDLRILGLPVLVGTSRKAFLGKLTGRTDARDRLSATLGSLGAVAALGAAEVVRVHDVEEARDALTIAAAIRGATDGGTAFGE